MSDEKFSDRLAGIRRAAAGEAEKVVPLFQPASEDALLPGLDSDYRAASLQSNKGLIRLCCIQNGKAFKPGGKPYRFFQYVHLDSDAEFGYDAGGQVMSFRFAGMMPMTVTAYGRNLLQICDYVQLHRLAWIREADRDFDAGDALDEDGRPKPIITRLEIVPAVSTR